MLDRFDVTSSSGATGLDVPSVVPWTWQGTSHGGRINALSTRIDVVVMAIEDERLRLAAGLSSYLRGGRGCDGK
jgi:hypothetical protein